MTAVEADLEGIAAQARAGDGTAFAALVRATQSDVWRLCRHLVDLDAADDLAQETYLRTLRALPGFAGDASVRTWLLAIARRVCADELRRRARARRLAGRVGRSAATVAGHAGHVELSTLIAALDADRRDAFVLTQVLDLSYAEAAQVCGCPVGTIRSRVARARSDLLGQLTDDAAAAKA